ncbi:2-oxo acid dehydrogenase subunit E2 [Actinoplanes sp. NPDC051851]|uniref:2-oxo acid dehydrogenase subunit E2 n=1 Tax=Actinoplanes sp. NPDC051851 TaxID=3154753 RepID=UPI003438C1A9
MSAPPLAGHRKPLSRIRRIIARRMRESLGATAQLTAVHEADVSDLVALRERAKSTFREKEGISLTFLPFFCRAVSEACTEHPEFNASLDENEKEVIYHPTVHLGVAVDTPAGLLVPVIRDTGDKTVPQLARAIADLAERARSGRSSPDELSGSTITISNIGGAGSLTETPILNYPEVAILGTGAIVRRPRVLSGPDGEQIVARSVCSLPLTYDHRLIDGAAAGRFLTTVRRLLTADRFEAELAAYL